MRLRAATLWIVTTACLLVGCSPAGHLWGTAIDGGRVEIDRSRRSSQGGREADGRLDLTITPATHEQSMDAEATAALPADENGRPLTRLVAAPTARLQHSTLGAAATDGTIRVPINLGDPCAPLLEVPAGHTLRVSMSGSWLQRPTTRENSARGRAEGASGRSASGTVDVDSSPPTLSVDIAEPSSGSAGAFGFDGLSSLGNAPWLLVIIGGLAVAAAAVVGLWLGRWGLAIALAAGGGGLIACGVLVAHYPWMVLVALGLLAAAAVWIVIDAWRGGTLWNTLRTIVLGVENTPHNVQEVAKGSIAMAAEKAGSGKDVKATVQRAKRKAGLA